MLGFCCFSQAVDYDDLYFNSTDRKILVRQHVKKYSNPVKKRSYLPSDHQNYDYYTEFEKVDTVKNINRLQLTYFFVIPMSVSNWTVFKMRNIHLVHPGLVTAYNYKYHSNLIEFPFPYVEGTRSRYVINWSGSRVNFWLMK